MAHDARDILPVPQGKTATEDLTTKTEGAAIATPTSLRDEEVLVRAAGGDQQAFGILYERYVSRVYSYVYYRTGSESEAEDLTARVFQRAMRHIHRYTDRGLPFSAWLYRIAHNLVANWHRDRSRRPEVALSEAPRLRATDAQPEHSAIKTQDHAELLSLIRRMPPERQTLLILKFVDDLSNLEIARIMGRSEGAIKSLYHRTLLALRDELGPDFAQEQEAGT